MFGIVRPPILRRRYQAPVSRSLFWPTNGCDYPPSHRSWSMCKAFHRDSTVIAPLPFQGFDESRHYLIAWDPEIMRRRPHGYSGSAAWRITQQTGDVWHPKLKFCGIATSFHRSQKAERIVRASAVVKFLTDTFGTPDYVESQRMLLIYITAVLIAALRKRK